MTLSLYSLFGVVGIIIFTLFYINTVKIKQNDENTIFSFRRLITWLILFFLIDSIWGLCDSGIISSPKVFFVFSTLFHFSTVITALFWISYVTDVFDDTVIKKNIIKFIGYILFLVQISLIIINFFTPTIFYISEDNRYVTAFLRPVAFYNQYILYVITALNSIFKIIKGNAEKRIQYLILLLFVGSPLVFGILQLYFPNAPFHTIGYLVGCTIIYSFVISGQQILFLKKFITEQKNQYKSYFDQSQKEITRNVEILYSMADVYYSMHLIDLVENSVIPYSARDEVKTIVNQTYGADLMMKQVISETVVEGFRDSALQFTDLKSLPERMKGKKILDAEFIGTRIGWFIAAFIAIEWDDDNKPAKVIFTTRSIDEEKKKEQHLIYKSNTDEMTGFYNRRAYENAISDYKKAGLDENFVYVSIDINGLKVINDSIGHGAGDELILGACKCMKEAFGPYGRLFRVGGDEFIALISATEIELELIKSNLAAAISRWKGELVESLSLACGYVSREEAYDLSLHDIIVMADKRMYEAKSLHYRQCGFDRRGQKDAHVALCALYTKILKINISDDTYTIVNMNIEEQKEELGFAQRISEWLYNFGTSGQVHPEDLNNYLEKTNLTYINNHFKNNKKPLIILYRRKNEASYTKVMMEIIPANDYSEEQQTYFLYVKNIE